MKKRPVDRPVLFEEINLSTADRPVLFEEINLSTAKSLIELIREMQLKEVTDAILEINSTGGSLSSALNICDSLVASGIRWTGIVIGECLSSAVIVLQACSIRKALPNASFLVHESRRKYVVDDLRASIPLQFYIDRLTDAHNGSCEIEARGNKILCSRLIADRKLFNRHFENNLHFSSQVALKMGLIDEIVTKV